LAVSRRYRAGGDLVVGEAITEEVEDLPFAGREDVIVSGAAASHAIRVAKAWGDFAYPVGA
jgi:hypothetical protein